MAETELKLARAPADKLLLGCVLAASAAYVVFLVVMQLTPRAPEGADKQGYLGVVTGESQPSGLGGGEQDPATGVAEVGGRRSAYYVGNGQTPRPVTLSERSPETGAATKLGPKSEPPPRSLPGTSQVGTLGILALEELLLTRMRELAESAPSLAPSPAPSSPLRPAGSALNPPPGHVRIGVGPN